MRKAKFPKKIVVAAYSQARREIQRFFRQAEGDLGYFDDTLTRLAADLRREDRNPAEVRRCIQAIEAFRTLYGRKRWGTLEFVDAPTDLVMRVEGVRINTRLDLSFMETVPEEGVFAGGLVLFMARTPESRKNIEERRRQVASQIYWSLEEGMNLESLPRLCMSFDVFGEKIVKASTGHARYRDTVSATCVEVASQWDDIEPPDDYDGPPM